MNPANWSTGTGSSVTALNLQAFSAIPEPASATALLGAAALAGAGLRRRRRS